MCRVRVVQALLAHLMHTHASLPNPNHCRVGAKARNMKRTELVLLIATFPNHSFASDRLPGRRRRCSSLCRVALPGRDTLHHLAHTKQPIAHTTHPIAHTMHPAALTMIVLDRLLARILTPTFLCRPLRASCPHQQQRSTWHHVMPCEQPMML